MNKKRPVPTSSLVTIGVLSILLGSCATEKFIRSEEGDLTAERKNLRSEILPAQYDIKFRQSMTDNGTPALSVEFMKNTPTKETWENEYSKFGIYEVRCKGYRSFGEPEQYCKMNGMTVFTIIFAHALAWGFVYDLVIPFLPYDDQIIELKKLESGTVTRTESRIINPPNTDFPKEASLRFNGITWKSPIINGTAKFAYNDLTFGHETLPTKATVELEIDEQRIDASIKYADFIRLSSPTPATGGAISVKEGVSSSTFNGRAINSRSYGFDVILKLIDAPQMSDQIIIEIGETGLVLLKSRLRGQLHNFASGEVESFIKILKKSSMDEKDARFTKQAGNFRIGSIGGDVFLNIVTSGGGQLLHYSIFTNSRYPTPRILEHWITKSVISDMINVLSQKDEVISELSGENLSTKIIKISMSKPGEGIGKGGLSLKVFGNSDIDMTVDEVDFKLNVPKNRIAKLRGDLNRALQYLKQVNRAYEEKPEKEFKIVGFGESPIKAKISRFDGNSDRFQFSAYITSDGEQLPRWVVIAEDQLAKLVKVLK